VSQIRSRWAKVEICLRADSGFAREELMAWCEENHVEYVFGLARNERLVAQIGTERKAAEREAKKRAPALVALRPDTGSKSIRLNGVLVQMYQPAHVLFKLNGIAGLAGRR